MKHTNTNEFKAKVKNYLLPIIETKSDDYETKIEGNPFAWCIETAKQEVPHEFERHGLQEGLKYWLSGCALNIAIYNSEIVELAEQWHECTLTEKERATVIENWFNFIAFKIIQFSNKG